MSSPLEYFHRSGPFVGLAEEKMPARFFAGAGNSDFSWQDFYGEQPAAIWSGFSGKRTLHLGPLSAPELTPPPAPPPLKADPEDFAGWEALCGKIQMAIERGELQKAVPARFRSFPVRPGEHRLLADWIFHKLFSPSEARAHRFLLRENEDIFFGASPELLFRRENGELFVPAIAGTRALRDGAESELAADLMASAKEREEHALVVEGIHQSLRSLGLRPTSPAAPEILKVPGLLHLFTPIRAADSPAISSAQLVAALHPTPAVGGLPKAPAQNFLQQNEPWRRGLFASPLLFRFGDRELGIVAIRSALLRKDRLYLFAGAGFVRGSKAESEWNETGRKMDVMQKMLFGENSHG